MSGNWIILFLILWWGSTPRSAVGFVMDQKSFTIEIIITKVQMKQGLEQYSNLQVKLHTPVLEWRYSMHSYEKYRLQFFYGPGHYSDWFYSWADINRECNIFLSENGLELIIPQWMLTISRVHKSNAWITLSMSVILAFYLVWYQFVMEWRSQHGVWCTKYPFTFTLFLA